MVLENGPFIEDWSWFTWFTYQKWWFSIATLNNQTVRHMISIWFPLCLILASPPRCRRSAWPLESLGLGNLVWLEKPWKSRMNGWKMAGQIYHKWKISTLRMASMCITGFNCHCAECEFWSWRADVWRLWRARASAKKYYGHPLADFPLPLGHACF